MSLEEKGKSIDRLNRDTKDKKDGAPLAEMIDRRRSSRTKSHKREVTLSRLIQHA